MFVQELLLDQEVSFQQLLQLQGHNHPIVIDIDQTRTKHREIVVGMHRPTMRVMKMIIFMLQMQDTKVEEVNPQN